MIINDEVLNGTPSVMQLMKQDKLSIIVPSCVDVSVYVKDRDPLC